MPKKTKKTGQTPLMKQYNDLKKKHPNTILLCRVGDFYEAFGTDAIKLSKLVNIVLTKRSNGSASSVELAGFPHHALDTYVPKLIKAGQRVAICDQLENPKNVKGLIKRGISELVTPGLSYHDHVLDTKRNNYLAAIHFSSPILGISFLDVSTGEYLTAQGNQTYIEKLVESFAPAEIIYNKTEKKTFKNIFQDHYHTHTLEAWVYNLEYAYERLNNHFGTTTLKGFGIETLPMGIIASGSILRYLEETEHHHLTHINAIARIEEEKYLWLNKFTIRNLELIQPQQESGVSLIQTLDKTVTPMGARMLKRWLLLPLKEIAPIQKRQTIVDLLVKKPLLAQNILQDLNQISDLERLISKVAAKRLNPRELLLLKKALKHTLPIRAQLKESKHDPLVQLGKQLHPCDFLLEKLHKTLVDNPPIATNQGNLIKKGIHTELDELRQIAFQGKDYLQQMLLKARKQTNIHSLKIGYNKIFGYYLEVTNTHKDKVPTTWIRKQTLVNTERYITEKLKTYEEKILHAEEKIYILEQQLYNELIESTSTFVPQIQQNAKILAELDCYLSFARQARKYNYNKPTINTSYIIDIKEGRHPVIEQHLPLTKKYIPNNIYLDNETQQILLITGPNMAGKSALLRLVALNVLMAQIGSFVPAKQATIGLVDKIFTRVGASDNLAMSESTFMVEMNEMASIVNNLSKRSLVIVDELGRGTSTIDGISIAQATIEYLHNHAKYSAKTLFATHYHDLNQLAKQLEKIKNYHFTVKEIQDKILFLHKLKAGGSPHSFGIQVAKMAGMPLEIIQRAQHILAHLTTSKKKNLTNKTITNIPTPQHQLTLFEKKTTPNKLTKALNKIEINNLTPIEALLKLKELKNLLNLYPPS